MARAYFQPSRADGRSDRQIVYDLVKDATPEMVFGYDQLGTALQEGVVEHISRQRVCVAVRAANPTLLRERKRCLRVVRNVGYRVVRADEHLELALVRKDRAQMQMRAGIDILRNVHVEELTPVHRALHEGQLLVLSGLYQAVQATERRQHRQEQVINEILQRVERLEQPA